MNYNENIHHTVEYCEYVCILWMIVCSALPRYRRYIINRFQLTWFSIMQSILTIPDRICAYKINVNAYNLDKPVHIQFWNIYFYCSLRIPNLYPRSTHTHTNTYGKVIWVSLFIKCLENCVELELLAPSVFAILFRSVAATMHFCLCM